MNLLSSLLRCCILASLLIPGFIHPVLAAEARPGLPILVYHRLHENNETAEGGWENVSLGQFKWQMRYLHNEGYRTLSMDEVVDFLKGKTFPEKIVAIQFDDGWKSQQEALPILQKYGFKATFWIIAGESDVAGSPDMNWNEITALTKSPDFRIYSHTMTHPWKTGDTLLDWVEGKTPGKGIEQAKWELTESKRLLEEKLGRPVPYLAWPSGIYNDTLLSLAKQAGYQALVTINTGLNYPGDDPFYIRRAMLDGTCDNLTFIQTLQDGKFHRCSM